MQENKTDKTLTEILQERNIPQLVSREKMLGLLLEQEYGHLPAKPDKMTWKVEENFIKNFCAGKANFSRVMIICELAGEEFSFPLYSVIPVEKKKYPFFVHINFRDCVPDRYMPTEELVDNGFAILSFCYEDVTKDNEDFTDGLAGVLYGDGKRKPNDAGKLAMWAWAAQRVMDYAETLNDLDMERSIVCGHSRLGKTALLTAATDERFCYAYSNDSGCSGAAISRGKEGESVQAICRRFPYWFCENYWQYADNECDMPFDQHYLIASIAPRYVCVGSASEDAWADPKSELLGCLAASSAYEKYDKKGFVCDKNLAEVGDCFFDGTIGYHLRKGAHYFSRADWLKLIEFVDKERE